MVPECKDLPSIFRLDRDFSRDEFNARIVVDRDEGWHVVGHCKQCGQVWQIEREDPHSRSGGFAIKIPNPARGTADDERAVRIQFLRQARGGDAASGECIVAGCTRRPLRGIAYCAEHAYALTGARE